MVKKPKVLPPRASIFWHFGHIAVAQRPTGTYILGVGQPTMDINALAISGSDPGAVPGVSTKHPIIWDHGDEIGSTDV